MKNKFLKIMSFILIVITIILTTNLKVFAFEPSEVLIGTQIQGGEELENFGGSILGIIMVVGVILAVIILIVIGIKYMTGSVEEKAGYKKALMPYAVGCIILVAAPSIANILYQFSESLQEEAPARIVKGVYHETCGKIFGECNCGVDLNEFIEGYYCTGCKNIISKQNGTYKCFKCEVEL